MKSKIVHRGRPKGSRNKLAPVVDSMPELAVQLVEQSQASLPATVGVNPETLIARAIDKGDINTLERLLAMRRELRSEWAEEQYKKALAAFQAECPEIRKTKVVKNRDGSERYRYAPLPSIVKQTKDLLMKHGFSYQIDPEPVIEEGKALIGIIVHHRDGHSKTIKVPLPVNASEFMNSIQNMGSTITYGSRYAFCAAFGIMTADDDDDGRGSGAPPRKQESSGGFVSKLKESIEYQKLRQSMEDMVDAATAFEIPFHEQELAAYHKRWKFAKSLEEIQAVYTDMKKLYENRYLEKEAKGSTDK